MEQLLVKNYIHLEKRPVCEKDKLCCLFSMGSYGRFYCFDIWRLVTNDV